MDGMLKTISYTDPGDFVAVKYTGSGRTSLQLMHDEKRCTENKQLGEAMHRICREAKERGVGVLIDAEQILSKKQYSSHILKSFSDLSSVQSAVDKWTLSLMRKYNTPDHATIYNTYQMYTCRSPSTLASHVSIAESEGWRLGIKLVRGAYLGSDPRDKIWPTKERTDEVYNDALRWLISSTTNSNFPDKRGNGKVDLMVATHNKESIEVARRLEKEGLRDGVGKMTYAQLMGMADELSLGLVNGGKEGEVEVYKYAVWGSVEECVKYLVRRARENKDAVGRSRENVEAAWGELRRRWKLAGSPRV